MNVLGLILVYSLVICTNTALAGYVVLNKEKPEDQLMKAFEKCEAFLYEIQETEGPNDGQAVDLSIKFVECIRKEGVPMGLAFEVPSEEAAEKCGHLLEKLKQIDHKNGPKVDEALQEIDECIYSYDPAAAFAPNKMIVPVPDKCQGLSEGFQYSLDKNSPVTIVLYQQLGDCIRKELDLEEPRNAEEDECEEIIKELYEQDSHSSEFNRLLQDLAKCIQRKRPRLDDGGRNPIQRVREGCASIFRVFRILHNPKSPEAESLLFGLTDCVRYALHSPITAQDLDTVQEECRGIVEMYLRTGDASSSVAITLSQQFEQCLNGTLQFDEADEENPEHVPEKCKEILDRYLLANDPNSSEAIELSNQFEQCINSTLQTAAEENPNPVPEECRELLDVYFHSGPRSPEAIGLLFELQQCLSRAEQPPEEPVDSALNGEEPVDSALNGEEPVDSALNGEEPNNIKETTEASTTRCRYILQYFAKNSSIDEASRELMTELSECLHEVLDKEEPPEKQPTQGFLKGYCLLILNSDIDNYISLYGNTYLEELLNCVRNFPGYVSDAEPTGSEVGTVEPGE